MEDCWPSPRPPKPTPPSNPRRDPGEDDPRRFEIHGDLDKPTLVHVEMRGPAFDGRYDLGDRAIPLDAAIATLDALREAPVPPVDLTRVLQTQAITAAAEVLNALRRCCLLDLCRTWPRLLTIVGVQPSGAQRFPRQSWEWPTMTEAVELALCYAEQPESHHWQEADALLRGYAMTAAISAESRRGNGDHYLMLTHNAGIYRAFAEGRS